MTTPDRRRLDLWLGGPPDGQPLLFHFGSPGAGISFDWQIRALVADRMVPFGHGQWLAAHIANACPHLLADQGHLSLMVDTFPQIIDELIAAPA